MSNDNERDDDDRSEEQDRGRNRGRGNDRDRGNKEGDLASNPSLFWRTIKNYVSVFANDLGQAGVASSLGGQLVEKLESILGEEAIKAGLPMAAAVVQNPLVVKQFVRQMGWPEEVNVLIDEAIDDWFEGVRMGVQNRGKFSQQDLNQHFAKARGNLLKRLNDEATFERSLGMVGEEATKKIDNFFFALPAGHQARFNALKPKLKTPADLRLFLQRVETLMQAHPGDAPSAILEKLEPAYGIGAKKADTEPSFASILGRLKKGVSKILGKADKVVTEAIEHPEQALNTIAADIRSNTERGAAKRAARKQRITELKGMR